MGPICTQQDSVPASSPNYVVVRRSRRMLFVRASALLVTMLVLAGGGWWYGRGEAESLRVRNAELALALDRTRAALDAAQRSAAELAVEGSVADGARAQARDEIRALTARVGELERELRFYRAVLPPEGGQGFRIASFEIHRLADRQWRWDLLLVQHFKAGREISGTLDIEIDGTRDGAAARMPLGSEREPFDFEFRYFQSLSGTLSLPDGFEPDSVRVAARAEGRKRAVEKRFRWPGAVVLAAAETDGEEE